MMSCAAISDNWKELDIGVFKINIPQNWEYQKQQGIDSFVGNIKISNSAYLTFDCSNMGYANHLIQTEQEYLNSHYWYAPGGYFHKPGIIYTNNSKVTIAGVRADVMKKRGITDTSLVKVEGYPENEMKKFIHQPTTQQKKEFPNADYVADITYRGSKIFESIIIPEKIKTHNIQLDSNDKYVYKTIWPKVAGKGMTGIYIHSRSSSFNFQMCAMNLPAIDQQNALKAFKTIIFNK